MRLIIDAQGTKLHKQGERLFVRREGQEDESFPINVIEQVVIAGRGVQATTPLLYDLVARGVDVIYQSRRGRFGFRLAGPHSGHSALRVRQVQVISDPPAALRLARAVVLGKLYNQATVLRRLGMETRALVDAASGARQAADLDALRGYEGSGAAAYFATWPQLFDARHWGFEGRAYHPPPDPVNALLSLGYTLLLNDIVSALYRIGLDPMVGVLHTLDYGRPSLALDLEEEFRPILIDRLVLQVLRQHILEPTDFTPRNGGYLLSDDARRFFIGRYEELLKVRVRHPTWNQQLTYHQCIQRQAEHLARYFLGRDPSYVPLRLGG
jgi:CRISPR-associated protein Cas1